MTKAEELARAISEQNYNKAYELYTELYSKNNKDYFSLFSRAVIGFSNLPEKMEQSIEDFEILISKKTKFSKIAKAQLALVYSNNSRPIEAIKYGEEALKYNPEFAYDLHYALSKSYIELFDIKSKEKALSHVNSCFELCNDDNCHLYVLKIEILIDLQRITEAEELLNFVYTEFGSSYEYYSLNAKLYVRQYFDSKNQEFLDKALSNADIALNYEENDYVITVIKIMIFVEKNDKKEAFRLLASIKDHFTDDEYLDEQLKLYDQFEAYDEAISYLNEYIKTTKTFSVYNGLGYFLSLKMKNLSDLKCVRELYYQAYSICESLSVFNKIYYINDILNDDEDNFKECEKLLNKYPDNGRLYYQLAKTKETLNFDYNDILNTYTKSYVFGYLEKILYYSVAISLADNPRKYFKYFKEFKKIDPLSLDPFMARRIGVLYLYGENSFEKDCNKALEILKYAYSKSSDDSCTLSNLGRCYEINDLYEDAFAMYNASYEYIKKDVLETCNCGYGYLAHAYINGIGTKQNIEYAKELILEAILRFKNKSSNIVIYLYAYFALLGDNRFDLVKAKEFLLEKSPFYRYELSRAMYLKLVKERLNENIDEVNNLIKLCVKYGNKDTKEQYKKNKDEKIIYPFINNF